MINESVKPAVNDEVQQNQPKDGDFCSCNSKAYNDEEVDDITF